MTDTPKRHWWQIKRIQGLVIMAAGVGMLFCPVTAPVAGTVVGVGAAWTGVGQVAKIVREK